jgi:hypothetical protein
MCRHSLQLTHQPAAAKQVFCSLFKPLVSSAIKCGSCCASSAKVPSDMQCVGVAQPGVEQAGPKLSHLLHQPGLLSRAAA